MRWGIRYVQLGMKNRIFYWLIRFDELKLVARCSIQHVNFRTFAVFHLLIRTSIWFFHHINEYSIFFHVNFVELVIALCKFFNSMISFAPPLFVIPMSFQWQQYLSKFFFLPRLILRLNWLRIRWLKLSNDRNNNNNRIRYAYLAICFFFIRILPFLLFSSLCNRSMCCISHIEKRNSIT